MASKRDMIKETRSTLIVKFKVSWQVELMITGDEGGKIFFPISQHVHHSLRNLLIPHPTNSPPSLSASAILCATL